MSVSPKLPALERRAAIVESAIKLFSEKGFRGATTRELASNLGVTEPVLYQHFATKRDLYSAIIEFKSNDVRTVLAELESYLDKKDDPGFFRHLASLILRFYEHDPAYLRLLLYSSLERHELSDLFHERQAGGFQNAVTHYIQRRMEEGALRHMDPVFASQSFMGMIAHYGMNRMLHPHIQPTMNHDDVVNGMVDIFLRGIQE